MLSKTKAIVLHHIKYGESSIIVTLYTEKYGRLASLVSGVRSNRSRVPMTFFQPLTLLEVELYYKANRGLQRLKEAACPFHYVSIPFVVGKGAIAMFLADVLLHTLMEEEGNAALFDFLYHALQLLDTRDENYASFHLHFLLHFARYLGFSPGEVNTPDDISHSVELHVFRDLSDEAANAMVQMMKNSLAQSDDLRLSYANRIILLDRILDFYSQHIEGIGRIKSRQILKEIFME
jgi:DNA repair protein RecO (recombination protein O)